MPPRFSSSPVAEHDPKTATNFLIEKMGIIMPVFIDFEFNRMSSPRLNLVCCSVWNPAYEPKPLEFWLHDSPVFYNHLRNYLLSLHKAGAVFYGYAIAAEARSVIALDIDPHQFRWVDLYAEWCQLTYNNHSCEYGTYYTPSGFKRFSVPPSFDKERNKGKDNNAIGRGLVDCAAQMFGLFIDSARKKQMRDLIIEDRESYTPAEQSDIMAYCSDDVLHLPAIAAEQAIRLNRHTKLDFPTIARVQQRRGSYSVSTGKMETVGFPLKIEHVKNLRRNFASAENTLIEDLVAKHYPFYVREKKRSSDLIGRWVDKEEKFIEFVKAHDLYATWPRTINKDTGKRTDTLSREDKVLAEYDGIPEIYAYRQTKKQIRQLNWFKEPDEIKRAKSGDFFDSVGPDDRLRTFLGPFGTQTGRNAPKASRFILAMSSWLRCLIEPPPGKVIIGEDYASQEFGIAAIQSQDKNMIAAYESGDPYLFFAKKAGAVPEDANPKWCKNPILSIAEYFVGELPHHLTEEQRAILPETARKTYANYVNYKFQRNLFKATTLGLQYGMGAAKLAVKLTADMGIKFTQDQAQQLINLHKRVYATFWQWAERIGHQYEREGCLILWDGWALLGDNDNILSVRNFPTQGGGGVIMREAVRLGHEKKLDILSPLHDALYALADEEHAERDSKILAECMTHAVKNVIGDSLSIRIDIDIHHHGEPWIEEKGEKYYKLLEKYLHPMVTDSDRYQQLQTTIFSEWAA